MIRFAFKKGLRFLENHKVWTLIRRVPTGKIQLEDEKGEIQSLEMSEIHTRWLTGEWVVDEESLGATSNVFYLATPRELSSFSEADQQIAKRKQAYLLGITKRFAAEGKKLSMAASALQPMIAAVAAEIDDAKPPSASAVQIWFRKYRVTKCVTKLVDGRSKSGRRRDETISSVFQEVLAEVFLTAQKRPGKAVVDAVYTKISSMNRGVEADKQIQKPARATVYRWLKDLYQALVLKARNGKRMTDLQLRSALKTVKVTKILERVEIDHTPVNVMVIDKLTKLVLGRPWLTLAIDRHSRAIVGFYLSFHAPSAFSVMYCLKCAMLPKEDILAKYPDIRNQWLCRGIMDLFACDNGMDLHADAFESVCCDLGIEILYCPAGEPQTKGAIERLMRTIAESLFHQLPGTTFSNVGQRGDYGSEGEACIDIETLTHLIVKWIADDYHQTPHKGLSGLTPHQAWLAGEAERTIELPAYRQQLDAIVGLSTTRTLFHYGIEHDCLRYNSPLLQLIRARTMDTPQLMIKFYEDDVGYINIFDPEQREYFRVPAVHAEYAEGLSRYVHRLVQQVVNKRFSDAWRHEDRLLVKAEMQSIVEQALLDKKLARRKKAAAVNATDSEQVFSAGNSLTEAEKPRKVIRRPDDLEPGLLDDLPAFNTTDLREAAV
jgi:putative transposase